MLVLKSTFFGGPFRRDYIVKIPFLTGAPFLGQCELLCTPADGCTTFFCSTASKLRVMEFLQYNLSETTLRWLNFSFFSCFSFFLCFYFFIILLLLLYFLFYSNSCSFSFSQSFMLASNFWVRSWSWVWIVVSCSQFVQISGFVSWVFRLVIWFSRSVMSRSIFFIFVLILFCSFCFRQVLFCVFPSFSFFSGWVFGVVGLGSVSAFVDSYCSQVPFELFYLVFCEYQ